MSDQDDSSQKARAGFEDLCRALNMDEEASNEAWKIYESISRNFTLEVKHALGPRSVCVGVSSVRVPEAPQRPRGPPAS